MHKCGRSSATVGDVIREGHNDKTASGTHWQHTADLCNFVPLVTTKINEEVFQSFWSGRDPRFNRQNRDLTANSAIFSELGKPRTSRKIANKREFPGTV